jgi:allantoinase
MSDFDLLVRSEQDFAIAEGTFVAIGANLRGTAREEIDASNLLLFPGVIDAHVHFNEPGRTHWEGFETGSRAAAAGGTTTVLEMPLNAHPPTLDGPSFDQKRAAAEASAMTDFGLWGGLVPNNLHQIKTLRDRGVVGLKAFMCNSGIDDFPYADAATLREGMRVAAQLELLVAVHAESQEITQKLTAAKLSEGKRTVRDYLESRPLEAELDAIQRAIDLAHETRCRLHIVHVSSGRGVELVAAARANGLDVTCETCPHYLVLIDDDMEKIGAPAKCAPPLRDLAEQRDLWKRLNDVSTIASDHSPSPPEMKQRDSFFEVWGGISSCQHLLPLLIDAAGDNEHKISLQAIRRLTSSNVADRFNLRDKGGIEVGKDADLTLVDLKATETIAAESLHYRHRLSPYLGRKLKNRVVRTILRGQTIYRDGKLAERPIGRFVQPQRP